MLWGLTAKKLGSASCPMLVIQYGTTLLIIDVKHTGFVISLGTPVIVIVMSYKI